MFSRRGFLGSIIGLISSTVIPFKAIEAIAEPTTPKIYNDLLAFKMGVILDDGTRIWAPSIIGTHIEDQSLTFKAHGIEATTSWGAKGLFVVSPMGRVVAEKDFECGVVPLIAGDELKLSYTVNTDHPIEFHNWLSWEPLLYKKNFK